MRHKHLIIEIHCLYGIEGDSLDESIPQYCKYGVEKPGYHCLENQCKHLGYSDAPNEIAFAGEKGEVPDDAWIGFGGDMEPKNVIPEDIILRKKLWEEVCRKKIDEAYDEYMKKVLCQ